VDCFTSCIRKRRTFAIISHPDAGKTTITEKLLLYGGAIQLAGNVKAKKSRRYTTSDWMELERKRGISVTSSVMNFSYKNHEINLIDTPGHEDFSEDTYRTLIGVDSVLILIDAASGVEEQTKKLFHICKSQSMPMMAFINKMDRPSLDPFDLIDNLEKTLSVSCFPVTWPINNGEALFQGVFDRERAVFFSYNSENNNEFLSPSTPYSLEQEEYRSKLGAAAYQKLLDDLELLQGAGGSFSRKIYLKGECIPVFFGSALKNFGLDHLLDHIIHIAPPPLARQAKTRLVEANESSFSAFIFKIQANMDSAHRDRVAFIRICSGKFTRGMKAFHVRMKRELRLARPTQFMAQDRSLVEEAYAGDIVGIHDPGLFRIGDTLTQGEILEFQSMPVFAPEHFVRVSLLEPLRKKQLKKALDQLSEEGAVQVLRPSISNDQYLGVVGPLQFDVVKFRIEKEYQVSVRFHPLPYRVARWIHTKTENEMKIFLSQQKQMIHYDQKQQPVVLIDHEWRLKIIQERYPEVSFHKEALY